MHIAQNYKVRRRLSESQSFSQLGKLELGIRSLGSVDARKSRFGSHLDSQNLIGPVGFRFVKDSLVEGDGIAVESIGSTARILRISFRTNLFVMKRVGTHLKLASCSRTL